jgi:hypothetical protein
MRKRRSETFAELYQGKTIEEVLREHTYGGTKDGVPYRQTPVLSKEKGIKMAWEKRTDEYPSMIMLEMTDGQWVKYRIEMEQAGFVAAMDIIRNPAHERGHRQR